MHGVNINTTSIANGPTAASTSAKGRGDQIPGSVHPHLQGMTKITGDANNALTATKKKLQKLLATRDQSSRPEWIRSPVSGYSPHVEIGRGKLYQLAKDGLIRSVALTEPGQIRATRLFHLPSILSYIESCERAATAATALIDTAAPAAAAQEEAK